MALNSIASYLYNNIKEIEENESIPPPRFSFSGQYKTISAIFNNHKNNIYDKFNLSTNKVNRKSKSFCSYFNVYKLYDNFFNENFFNKNDSRNKKYFKKNFKKEMKEYKYLEEQKISKSISNKTKSHLLFPSEFDNSQNLYNKRINNKRVIKKFRNISKKINNKIPRLNLEEEDDNDKPKIKINESLSLRNIKSERSNINYTCTDFYNNKINNKSTNNLLLKLKKVPYIRKKAKNKKKEKVENNVNPNNLNNSQSISLKNFSIHSEKSIKKGRPKKINKSKKLFDISLLNSIKRNDGILCILRFLDYYDIMNIFETKNKKLLLLIYKSITKSYYMKIKNELSQYNSLFDLIEFSIFRSKIKDALKIDIIANIRININQGKNDILEPVYIKLGYAYNFFRKIKFNKDLITKEEYEIQTKLKNEKLCDYYSFDFYPYKIDSIGKDQKNNRIYISKELPIQGKDCNNIAAVQSVLSFFEQDEGILNFEIYNAEKGFVNYEEIKISMKIYNLKNYLKYLAKKEISNIRISEYEELCSYWKNISLYEYKDLILKMMKTFFGNYFEIQKIFFENIGIFIFKVHLKAIKNGLIKNKKSIGINIKIVEKNENIKNEIRKNNLLFEKRDIVEIRVGDEIIYYFCLK